MASWGFSLKNQQIPIPNLKGFHDDQNDLVMMGFMLSPKKHDCLIQNCDLPPPMKVFSGSHDNKTSVLPTSIQRIKKKKTFSLMGNYHDHHEETIEESDGNLGILKALRLSQTRAREAGAKCAAISKERDLLAFAFMEDSMQIFAYRHLVRLLEVEVSRLQKRSSGCGRREKVEEEEEEAEGENGGSGSGGFKWIMAMALCFGIAGFGFALGCKYNYF